MEDHSLQKFLYRKIKGLIKKEKLRDLKENKGARNT